MEQQWYKFLCILITVLTIFSSSANAIKCYQCSSVNDTRCATLTHDNQTLDLYRECDGDYHGKQPFCRKTVQTIIDEVKIVRVHRSCGWEEDNINSKPCYKYENDFHFEIVCVCSESGCNVAPQSRSPAAPLTIAAAFGTALFLLRLHR